MNYKNMSFGARIALARRLQHNLEQGKAMSQARLAELSGLAQSQISRLEKSQSSGSTKLIEIADALGVNAHWLRTGKGSPDKASLSSEEILQRQSDKQRSLEPYLRLKKTIDSLNLPEDKVEAIINEAILSATKML
ncbi:hypothetical protein VCR14J2_390348 [Vibrio coralliirubri]|uniref:helix-turn-helix domain-containing protein n=1 Tax=Vibrio coralliirubri TaxID=1516159 RepID=UPI00063634CF|nr:helix-turn-helix transcriptional regulator [Vibrio coralliirubri]CDU05708.1 hypothetical protein VCR14J2_390348 [Vibrio coralliirubri]